MPREHRASPCALLCCAQTPHFHNLTDTVRQALYQSLYRQHLSGGRAYRLQLPNYAQVNGWQLALLSLGSCPCPMLCGEQLAS